MPVMASNRPVDYGGFCATYLVLAIHPIGGFQHFTLASAAEFKVEYDEAKFTQLQLSVLEDISFKQHKWAGTTC